MLTPSNENQNEQILSNAPPSDQFQNDSINTIPFSENKPTIPSDQNQNEQIALPSNQIQQSSGTLPSSSNQNQNA